MFLNLKGAGDAEVNEGTNIPNNVYSNGTISDPQFAAPVAIPSSIRAYTLLSVNQ